MAVVGKTIDDVKRFIRDNQDTTVFILIGEVHMLNPYINEKNQMNEFTINIGNQIAILESAKSEGGVRRILCYNEVPYSQQRSLLANKKFTAFYIYHKSKELGIPLIFSKVSTICREIEGRCDNRYGKAIAKLGEDNTIVVASLGLLHVINVSKEIRNILPDAKIMIINASTDAETIQAIKDLTNISRQNAEDLSSLPAFSYPEAKYDGQTAFFKYFSKKVDVSELPKNDTLQNVENYLLEHKAAGAPAAGAGGGAAAGAGGGAPVAAPTFDAIWVDHTFIKCPECGLKQNIKYLSPDLHAFGCKNKGKMPKIDFASRPAKGGRRYKSGHKRRTTRRRRRTRK